MYLLAATCTLFTVTSVPGGFGDDAFPGGSVVTGGLLPAIAAFWLSASFNFFRSDAYKPMKSTVRTANTTAIAISHFTFDCRIDVPFSSITSSSLDRPSSIALRVCTNRSLSMCTSQMTQLRHYLTWNTTASRWEDNFRGTMKCV